MVAIGGEDQVQGKLLGECSVAEPRTTENHLCVETALVACKKL